MASETSPTGVAENAVPARQYKQVASSRSNQFLFRGTIFGSSR
jgi:hypothetical protein